ncbi:beta-ketoacyl synthase N-terminal-like domain-containing protein [Streptomyces sp. DASNCL29]|uniref:beta-ketoacyl synthase N-terminal-like domain-containing protein n=1 Tax=Streptomyces sp. DASNCL29 TaxID=2583819 RepID=UPI003211EEF5
MSEPGLPSPAVVTCLAGNRRIKGRCGPCCAWAPFRSNNYDVVRELVSAPGAARRGTGGRAVCACSREEQSGDIAIVGLSCRLPGGITAPEGLWAALATGRDLVGEIPADRFDALRFVDPDPRRPGKAYTAAGGFLADIAGFDAAFFGLSPREASRMDPQQRLLLEMAREALDDAGIDSGTLAGSDSGVYVGVSNANYGQLQYARPEAITAYTMAGAALCNTANRISHLFDLRGPSMAVDTACSSSLVALHQACAQLRAGDGGVALVCGINLLLSPGDFIGFSKASMLSRSGRCRSFSADADGYVRAEGGAAVVLKRLADAKADGDTVHAVVLGTGVGADGRTPGLSLPSALRARLSVFGGLDDPMVDPGTLHERGACTTADARVHRFPGGHHCLRTQVARVVGRLTDDLLAAYRSPASG